MIKGKGAGKILLTTALAGTATTSAMTQSTSTSADFLNFWNNKKKSDKITEGSVISGLSSTFYCISALLSKITAGIVVNLATNLPNLDSQPSFGELLPCLVTYFVAMGVTFALSFTFTNYAIAEDKFSGLWKNRFFLNEDALNRIKIADELNKKFDISLEKLNSSKGKTETEYCVVIKDKKMVMKLKNSNWIKNTPMHLS